jgi:hypothetical protein
MPYAAQGLKGPDDDDDIFLKIRFGSFGPKTSGKIQRL